MNAASAPLTATDQAALVRLIRLFAGKQFKLVVVECATPDRRQRILDLLREVVAPREVAEVALDALPLQNLWAELAPRRGDAVVLAVYGLEERPDDEFAAGLAQLNVQRDLFVRDMPVPWVLFVHPARARALRDRAPDLCDLASLWLREELTPIAVEPPTWGGLPRPVFEIDEPRLAQVARLADMGDAAGARDALARYDLAGGHDHIDRSRAEAAVLLAEGRYAEASERLAAACSSPEAPAGVHAELARVHLLQGDHVSAAAALAAAEARGPSDERDRALVARARAGLEAQTGRAADALRTYTEVVLPALERSGLERERVRALGEVAVLAVRTGDADAAHAAITRMREAAEGLGDAALRADALGYLAGLRAMSGDLAEALRIRRDEQLPAYERLGDERARARVLDQIGAYLEAQGQLDEAVRIWRDEVLPAFERLRNDLGRADTLGRIAGVLWLRGDVDAALQIHLRERIPVYERLGGAREVAQTLESVARMRLARGEVDEGLRLYRYEVLPTYERLGDDLARSRALRAIAIVLAMRGDMDGALRSCAAQLPLLERLGHTQGIAATLLEIAHLLSGRSPEDALRLVRDEALPRFRRVGDVHGSAVALSTTAGILEAIGDVHEALAMNREALAVYHGLGDSRSEAKARTRIASLLRKTGRVDEALRSLRDDVLPVYEGLGDTRGRAIAIGLMADILERTGDSNEAHRLRVEQELPVYERLGDARSRALTLSSIARHQAKLGDRDDALRILTDDVLPVVDRMGLVRERAATLLDIADLRAAMGDVDEAINLVAREVVPPLEGGPHRGDLATSRMVLGALLVQRGRSADRSRARKILRAAREDATAAGDQAVIRACDELLEKAARG